MCVALCKKFLVVGSCTMLSLGAMSPASPTSPRKYTRQELLAIRASLPTIEPSAKDKARIEELQLSPDSPRNQRVRSWLQESCPHVRLVVEQEKLQSLLSRMKEIKNEITFTRQPRNRAYCPTINALARVIAILDGSSISKRKADRLVALRVVINNGFSTLCTDRFCPVWFKVRAQEMEGLLDAALSKKSSTNECQQHPVPTGWGEPIALEQGGEQPAVWNSQLFLPQTISGADSVVSTDGADEDTIVDQSDQNRYSLLCEEKI